MAMLPEHLRATSVGRERLPREVAAEHRRDRILTAAIEVFAERGYLGATVEGIVAAARVGVGSFYARFESREACFVAAYDRVAAVTGARIAAATPAQGAWGQRLVAALEALLEAIEDDPAAARLGLVEVHAAGTAAIAHHARNLDRAAELLREGRDTGGVAADLPESLEFATISGLGWYLQQRVAAGTALDAAALLPEVLEIVAEPYLATA